MISKQWKRKPVVYVCLNVREIGKHNFKIIKKCLSVALLGKCATGNETCRSLQNQKKLAYASYVALILFYIIPIVFVYKTRF